jgi:hypothetical protein
MTIDQELTCGKSGEYFLEDRIERFCTVKDHNKHGRYAGEQF